MSALDEVDRLLRRLRLPYFRAAAVDVLQSAKAQWWDPAEAVKELLEEEVAGRDQATIAARTRGRLPRRQELSVVGRVDVVDTGADPTLAQDARVDRTQGEPVRVRSLLFRQEPLPRGARPLRHRQRDAGRVVQPQSPRALVRRNRADNSVAKAISKICRAELIAVDHIGLLPVGQDAAEDFYRVIDAAHERRSVAVSSNHHPGFDELMPKTLATATVDRLLHHAMSR